MDYDPFASTLNNQDFGDSDPFKGTLSTDAIPKSENLLQRAANKLMQPTIDSLAQAVGGTLTRNPWEVLKGVGTAQASGYKGLMDAKNEVIGDVVKNPLLRFGADVATDPMTYLAGEPAIKGVQKAGEGAINFGRDQKKWYC